MSKIRLARKCSCGNVMMVDATNKLPTVFVGHKKRHYDSYGSVECISGCQLAIFICGRKYAAPTLNKDYFRAVYCQVCLTIRHLNLFKEVKI